MVKILKRPDDVAAYVAALRLELTGDRRRLPRQEPLLDPRVIAATKSSSSEFANDQSRNPLKVAKVAGGKFVPTNERSRSNQEVGRRDSVAGSA